MPSFFDRCFGREDRDNELGNYGKIPAQWRAALGEGDYHEAANVVEMDVMAANGNFHPGQPQSGGSEYGQLEMVPVVQAGEVIIKRLTNSRDRNKAKAIVAAVAGAIAAGLTGVLTWYFVGGPGAAQQPSAKDDQKDNVPAGPAPVDVDILGNDTSTLAAKVLLVGADAQGVVTQKNVGKWEVTANRMVQFTPGVGFDFKTHVEVHYQLDVNGNFSNIGKITIIYANASATPDPASDIKRANFSDTVTFDIQNAKGNVLFEKPDPTDATRQTVKDVGVWAIADSETVTFTPDANIAAGSVMTTIQVDFGSQRSKPATLTVFFNRPVAGQALVQKITPGCPASPIDVVALSAAVPPNTLDAASVKLVGLQDVETGSAPAQFQIQKQGTSLSATGEGVWMVSTDGRITFVPETGANLVNNYTPGKDQTYQGNFVGMKFTSAADQSLVRLGVRKASLATTGKWKVSLTDTSGKELTSAEIDVTSTAVGDFTYASACYRLKKGTDYYLVAEVDSSKVGQTWSDEGAVTLDATVATGAAAVYADTQRNFRVGTPGNMYVGVDFTVAKFLGSPTPALYTIADNHKNASAPAKIVLNYGDAMSPQSVNDPSDTSFFANLQQNAFAVQPPLPLVLLLAALVAATNMTGAMLDVAAKQTSPVTDIDQRYTKFKAGATADDLWNVCSDIDTAKLDPGGKQSPFYARYWRLRTMQTLLDRLVLELKLT